MILEVLNAWEAVLVDAVTGFNAEVASINAAKGTTAPALVGWHVWDNVGLPHELAMPCGIVNWESSPTLELPSQTVFDGEHIITTQVWTESITEPRKHVAVYAHALYRLLEKLVDSTPVMEVRQPRFDVVGWRAAGNHTYAVLMLVFTVAERDPNP